MIRYFTPRYNGSTPSDSGRDAEIVASLGLPPLHPEIAKFWDLKRQLLVARDLRSRVSPPPKAAPVEPAVSPFAHATKPTRAGLVKVPRMRRLLRPNPEESPYDPAWRREFKVALAEQRRRRKWKRAAAPLPGGRL